MNKRKIYVTEQDKIKLTKLFSSTVGFRSRDLKTVKDLLSELERAVVIEEDNSAGNIVKMNSVVHIKDLDTGQEYEYTIVYPEFADSSQNKISILAPIGTALLGYKKGDTISWEVPKGKRKLKILNVYNDQKKENRIAI
jgi:regulator of nucleoside diphosphate kinase